MNVRATLVITLSAALAAIAQAAPASFENGVDAAAAQVLETTGVPSASVAVIRDGRTVLVRAYGHARLQPEEAANPVMRYSVGSVSKEFLAATIMLLVEQGKLSLDDKVAKYFPRLTDASRVTIRDLLNHTSGYRDYWPQDYVPATMLQPITTEKLIQDWATLPLDFEPGSQYQYSNTGYVIAGAIVEKVTGQPVMDAERQRIFEPLGMHSVVDVNLGRLGPEDATGYMRYTLGPPRLAPKEGAGWLFAAGGLAMTAADLARWDVALLTGKLLKPASFAAMSTTRGERVRWGDVDAASIIFYGSYIRFFEIAETELFRSVGMPYGKVFDELDIWLPRVHLECDFHRAPRLDDLLEVSVYIGSLGRTSLRLNFEVRRKTEDGTIEKDLMATAHFVLVSTDRKNLKPIPTPLELRRALEPYLITAV
jgi:YbgC/YbaW family acyl-CoA thioester hydrolase